MAVAVQQGPLGHGFEREVERACPRLPRQEFLEQQRVRGQEPRVVAFDERGELIAETQQAARLEADDRHSTRGERRERGDAALRLAARLIDEADGEEGASAAERPRPPSGGFGRCTS